MQNQKTHVNVLESVETSTGEIKDLCKELKDPTKQNDKAQKHITGKIKTAVFALCNLTFAAIENKVIKADATGVITGKSIFPDEIVDKFCMEWRASMNKEKLADVCGHALLTGQMGGKWQQAKFKMANGVNVIFDKAKQLMTWIWNGAIESASWIYDKAIKFKDWIIAQTKMIWGKIMSFFAKKGDTQKVEQAHKAMDDDIIELEKLAA